MTASTLLATLIMFAALTLVSGAGAVLSPLPMRSSLAGPTACGIAAVGVLAGAMLIATRISLDASRLLGIGGLLFSAAALLIRHRAIAVRPALVIVSAGLGVLITSLGLFGGRGDWETPFVAAASRFLPGALPADNFIPSQLASWFEHPSSGRFLVGDWLPSDRPPLQAGIILFARSAFMPIRALTGGFFSQNDVDFSASVVSQLLWIPAAVCLCIAIGFRLRTSIAAIAFAAIVPVMFINTIYTWPKLLAGGMAVAAVGALVAGLRGILPRSGSLFLATFLSVLAVLSHGGAAFMLPMVVVLGALLWASISDWRSRTLAAAGVLGIALASYAPWFYFQRVVSPPGDRLLKWHLAGVIPIDGRTFLQALVDQYSALGWTTFFERRASNIARAFDLRLWQYLDVWTPGARADRATAEFYETPIALALGVVPIIALGVAVVISRLRGHTMTDTTRWTAVLAAGALACVALWAVLMFGDAAAVVHQGSHAWIILLLVVPFAWLVRSRPAAAMIVAAVQFLLTLVLSWTSFLDTTVTLIPGLVALGIGILVASIAFAHRRDRGADECDLTSGPALPSSTKSPGGRRSASVETGRSMNPLFIPSHRGGWADGGARASDRRSVVT